MQTWVTLYSCSALHDVSQTVILKNVVQRSERRRSGCAWSRKGRSFVLQIRELLAPLTSLDFAISPHVHKFQSLKNLKALENWNSKKPAEAACILYRIQAAATH